MSPADKQRWKEWLADGIKMSISAALAVGGFIYAAGGQNQKIIEIDRTVNQISTVEIPALRQEDKTLREKIGECEKKGAEQEAYMKTVLNSLERIEHKIDKHMERAK